MFMFSLITMFTVLFKYASVRHLNAILTGFHREHESIYSCSRFQRGRILFISFLCLQRSLMKKWNRGFRFLGSIFVLFVFYSARRVFQAFHGGEFHCSVRRDFHCFPCTRIVCNACRRFLHVQDADSG